MRSLRVVIVHELANQVVEVPLPEGDEVVQAFLLQRLNEALGIGIEVR